MKSIILIALALTAAGCEQRDSTSRDRAPAAATGAPTGVAKPDKIQETVELAPGDQGQNETDRAITRSIRQSVASDRTLATSAKTVNIVTLDAVVTLLGKVTSEEQRTQIGGFAQGIESVKLVENKLEIATQ